MEYNSNRYRIIAIIALVCSIFFYLISFFFFGSNEFLIRISSTLVTISGVAFGGFLFSNEAHLPLNSNNILLGLFLISYVVISYSHIKGYLTVSNVRSFPAGVFLISGIGAFLATTVLLLNNGLKSNSIIALLSFLLNFIVSRVVLGFYLTLAIWGIIIQLRVLLWGLLR